MVSPIESNERSFAKAVSYRVYESFVISPIIVFYITHNISMSLKFGILEFIIKVPAYYVFERIWAQIKFRYSKGK